MDRENNEKFGMSCELALCELFNLDHKISESRTSRSSVELVKCILKDLPFTVSRHIGGSNKIDFMVNNDTLSLSLKSNKKGYMVCPQVMGQKSKKGFCEYFEQEVMDVDSLKKWIYDNPKIIVSEAFKNLFCCDILLWISLKGDHCIYQKEKMSEVLSGLNLEELVWKRCLSDWKESNVLKYNDQRVAEVQIHNNRDCVKVRFDLRFFGVPKLKLQNKDSIKSKMQMLTSESNGIEDCEYFEYFTNFVSKPEQYMNCLLEEIQFEQNQVFVFGKLHAEPRLTSIHGDDSVLDRQYVYSKSVRILKPMTPTLLKLKKLVKFYTEIDFDFVLINYYRDGNDKVGWHADDETMMDCSNIASISLGEERTFKFRDKQSKKTVWKKQLENGSLVWMKENCQRDLEHEVPKTSKTCGPRMNLTFRKFK